MKVFLFIFLKKKINLKNYLLDTIRKICFTKDGKFLITASWDKSLKFFEFQIIN